MTDKKTSQITTDINNTDADSAPDQTRRIFLQKYGKLAVVTPVALTALMTPNTSHAINSNACKNDPDKKVCDKLNANGGF